MSTYRQKIEKYKAKIDASRYAGVEPSSWDVAKLKYYSGKAVKKGLNHDVSIWAKTKALAKATYSAADVTEILETAARLLITKK